NGNNFTILNGIQRGNNLFHSFKEFSIPTGGTASFNNSTDVVNIINRVTGGNISNIDGLIKANGSANLFLINPVGIMFGENARLDIGGSFLGTTAESLLFEDGFEFSAVNAQSEPLLTVNVPLGLQMGSNSGGITVKGSGHGLTTPLAILGPLTSSDSSRSNLQVQSGKTLALIGNDISLNGANLNAPSGQIELGSFASGQVNLQPNSQGWTFAYDLTSQFSPITLSEAASLDVSGAQGSIQLQGSRVAFQQGSILRSTTLGDQDGGKIQIDAQDSLSLLGTNADSTIGSGIIVDTIAQGSAANVQVSARNALFQGGGVIASRTYGAGAGGKITLMIAESTDMLDFAPANPFLVSGLWSTSWINSTGKVGDIDVSTGNLKIIDGAGIAKVVFGSGAGGNATIRVANRIEVTGMSPILNPSGLSSANSGSTQNPGSLVIYTKQLDISDGGAVLASLLKSGQAGDIEIYATESIVVRGQRAESKNSSTINSSAQSLDPDQRAIFGLPEFPSGNAGSVIIHTPLLEVNDGGSVSVLHEGQGDAGRLEVNANTITLSTRGNLSAETNGGSGGNIFLNANSIQMRQESSITAKAGGTGNGGNITINSPVILGLENSDIIANAVEGNGGNINIKTRGIFGLKFSDRLTPESDITASSQFGLSGKVILHKLDVNPVTSLVKLPSNLKNKTQIQAGCRHEAENKFVVLGRGALPQQPSDLFNGSKVLVTLLDFMDEGKIRSNISPENNNVNYDNQKKPIVEATGFMRNENGEIELVATHNTPLQTKSVSGCSGISS
ncbi:MAG: filamentous hemagglutinin N-terminal domain-containing protein, partial [Cyanobacteria bacterium J06632_19]